MPPIRFHVDRRISDGAARTGRVDTPHGSFETPAFMPVGTQAAVKGLLPEQVAETGAQILLSNTYHLLLRPGPELIETLGGLQRFMGWDGPVLTDSGGFQVFSLADIRQLDEDGVRFRNDVDGAEMRLSPESAIEAQNQLGADIIMALDDCPPASAAEVSGQRTEDEAAASPSGGATSATQPPEGTARHAIAAEDYEARNRLAVERTVRWLRRCTDAHRRPEDQALFGIVQGGTDLELRSWCAQQVTRCDLPGYAIGGLAVGEGYERMMRVVRHTAPLLPEDKPRYLMGVGYERDLVEAVKAGVDMFDCVLPTRNGRNGNAFTRAGQLRVRNAAFAEDARPIEPGCDCAACRRFSRAYLRHLLRAGEMLGPILVSLHNLRHFQRLMLDIRAAIREDAWSLLRSRWPALGPV